MSNLELIFCKSNKIMGSLIGLYTYGQWAHVAIKHSGTIVEASAMHGVRVTDIENLKKGNAKVVGIKLEAPCGDDELTAIISAEVGKGYDWGFIFNAFFRTKKWDDPKKWACSELGSYIVQKAGMQIFNEDEKIITPVMLYLASSPLKKQLIVYR